MCYIFIAEHYIIRNIILDEFSGTDLTLKLPSQRDFCWHFHQVRFVLLLDTMHILPYTLPEVPVGKLQGQRKHLVGWFCLCPVPGVLPIPSRHAEIFGMNE